MGPVRERRVDERQWMYRNALLCIPGLKGAYSCYVRDLNERGVGLWLNMLPLLPTEFKLSLDGFRTTLSCRLVWRNGDFAGVEFERDSGPS